MNIQNRLNKLEAKKTKETQSNENEKFLKLVSNDELLKLRDLLAQPNKKAELEIFCKELEEKYEPINTKK